jgi:hypothetical protein
MEDGELRICKEAVVAQFEGLTQHLHRRLMRKITRKSQSGNMPPDHPRTKDWLITRPHFRSNSRMDANAICLVIKMKTDKYRNTSCVLGIQQAKYLRIYCVIKCGVFLSDPYDTQRIEREYKISKPPTLSTERSPSWESSINLRWSLNSPFLIEHECLLPCSQEPTEALRNILQHTLFLRWGVVSPQSTPKLEDHPLSAVHDCYWINRSYLPSRPSYTWGRAMP